MLIINSFAMAPATGLGAIPFFFVELEPQWAGVCNGMAAGVMLAASFDLVQEGQVYGGGSWVVIGILSGGIFILLCKKVCRASLCVVGVEICFFTLEEPQVYAVQYAKLFLLEWKCLILFVEVVGHC